jgi:dihydropteroate synthase
MTVAKFLEGNSTRLHLCPEGILEGAAARHALGESRALPLAGGPLAFAAIEAIARESGGGSVSASFTLAELKEWAAGNGRSDEIAAELDRLAAPRAPWAGFALDRPLILGILNVTPDSFSDGGAYLDPATAIARGRAMRDEGADIVDVGGESTRPGSDATLPEEELRRVVPVIEALARDGIAVSVDTRRAVVMRAALEAGARIINDVSALTDDRDAMAVAAASDAALILMHKAGEPRTMQRAPVYGDVALDVLDYLEARVVGCAAAGIARSRILVDPGFGFGKHPIEHNLPLLRRLALFHGTGCGVLAGLSRKSFIALVSRNEPPQERVAGSIAAALWAASRGVQAIRVHDVAGTRQALAVRRAILDALP